MLQEHNKPVLKKSFCLIIPFARQTGDIVRLSCIGLLDTSESPKIHHVIVFLLFLLHLLPGFTVIHH